MKKEERVVPDNLDEHEGIAYQNKDIASKYFAEEYKDTLFKVYGLDLPDIVSIEPTELPAVEANDMFMDNLFLLADGSYAIIDYESKYTDENKVKYLGYVARLVKRLYNQNKKIPKIRVVIVYTADVSKGSTNNELDLYADKLMLTEVFLSELDATSILAECKEVIEKGSSLQPIQKLRLMLCPLSEIGKEAKRAALRAVIDLAKDLSDEEEQRQILAGMIAFSDKIISRDDAEEIRRLMSVTKVGQIIYEEQEEAVKKAVDSREVQRIEDMLRRGKTVEEIVDFCGYPYEQVKKVEENLVATAKL